MNKAIQRYHEIDLLRGLACLAVVAYHYFSRGPRGSFGQAWMPGVNWPAVDEMSRYGYLGVHLFFAISGFVIFLSADGANARSFVASRVARLYPAFWIACSGTALVAWIFADPMWTVSMGTYLVNLTMVPHWFDVPLVDGAYWSLLVEFHFYMFVFLALRFGAFHRIEVLLAIWLALSAINALRPMWPVQFWLNAAWAPLFSAGAICYLVRRSGWTVLRACLLVLAFALALFYAIQEAHTLTKRGYSGVINPVPVTIIVTGIFALFIAIATRRFRIPYAHWIGLLATLTYPVYLVHQNIGYMMHSRLHAQLGSSAASLGITFLAVVLLAFAIHKGVELRIGPRLRRWIDPLKA